MDISKVGSEIPKVVETNTTQNQATNQKSADDIKDVYSPGIESAKKAFLYSKNITNAQLIEKFTEFTNKHVAKQVGNVKAYIQGFMDGSKGTVDAKALEDKLYEKYGIVADLDPKNVQDGGKYSAENLSDTLVQFAKNISGGDVSKADMLLEAAKKGFEIAQRMWGDELPEISQRTYDLMVEKFEAWKSGEE